MVGRAGLAAGLALVLASMLFLFTVPQAYFVPATFISTSCMIFAAVKWGGFGGPSRPRYASILLGTASAGILYGIFYAGGWLISVYHPFGITSASETPIYSLISSPSNPFYLQVGVLLFDSAGYESFFRGSLQARLSTRMGVAAAPAIALLDAGMHILTLNPLWVGATFVTDMVWGLSYHYGRGAQASFTSHFLWDLAIFVIRPIK